MLVTRFRAQILVVWKLTGPHGDLTGTSRGPHGDLTGLDRPNTEIPLSAETLAMIKNMTIEKVLQETTSLPKGFLFKDMFKFNGSPCRNSRLEVPDEPCQVREAKEFLHDFRMELAVVVLVLSFVPLLSCLRLGFLKIWITIFC